MLENKQEFYHSKGKLFLGVIFTLLIAAFGALIVSVVRIEDSLFMVALAWFIIVLFTIFAVSNILKIIRGYPYITITNDYIQLDSGTKSEVTIYFTDIRHIRVSEIQFNRIIEIVLYHQDEYFYELSFHNKVRLFMNRIMSISLFTINAKAVRKPERAALFETLDFIMQHKLDHQFTNSNVATEQDVAATFAEKYDPAPPVDRTINKSYFLRTYGYSLFIFALMFVLFYLLDTRNNNYLTYIIVSFILYPFAKVPIDLLFGFKLKEKLDKQKGFTYYFVQAASLLDLLLFHVSIFVAPIGIIALLVRSAIGWLKQQ